MRYKFWTGEFIGERADRHENVVLVFGSNPQGRHGKGTALTAKKYWGAIYGKGRGIQGDSYALVTKNLKANYSEASTGITYKKYGRYSVTKNQIMSNIIDLYKYAMVRSNKLFVIPYIASSENLNGYSSDEMFDLFQRAATSVNGQIPYNIVFHESYKGRFITHSI